MILAKKTRFAFLLPVLGVFAGAQTPDTFTPTGNMITPRFGHMATLLPDGKVLIAGGNTVCYFRCIGAESAELYDPATGTFAPAGAMKSTRPTGGVLLPDGRVLFAESDFTGALANIELYDPSTGIFRVCGNTATLTAVYLVTMLNDGRVLLSGKLGTTFGYGAEVYDPVNGTFFPIANWPAGDSPISATALVDGRVVLEYSETQEVLIYYPSTGDPSTGDPSTGTFSVVRGLGPLNVPPVPALLLNGKILLTGGTDFVGPVSSAKLFDPAAESLAASPPMSAARSGHSATLLPDGTVLVAGGGCCQLQPSLASAEMYDPATGRFAETGSLNAARFAHRMTLLNSGQVLVTGGIASLSSSGSVSSNPSAELYTPAVVVPAPMLFSLSGDGRGQGSIWHALTGQIASAENRAVAGEVLSMYTTNLADDSLIPPQVAIGGRLAEILYFGVSSYAGYKQVNFRLPGGVAPGPAVPVRLNWLGRPSNEITIGVQ